MLLQAVSYKYLQKAKASMRLILIPMILVVGLMGQVVVHMMPSNTCQFPDPPELQVDRIKSCETKGCYYQNMYDQSNCTDTFCTDALTNPKICSHIKDKEAYYFCHMAFAYNHGPCVCEYMSDADMCLKELAFITGDKSLCFKRAGRNA
jgi:hypothetical protein